MRLAFDEDVDHRIVRGLMRRSAGADLVTIQGAELSGAPDPHVLDWAAADDRVLVTADRNTLVGEAWVRVQDGRKMPGVLVVSRTAPLGDVIDDLALVVEQGRASDFENMVSYLPLPSYLTSSGRRYR